MNAERRIPAETTNVPHPTIEEPLEQLQTILDRLSRSMARMSAAPSGLRLRTFQELAEDGPFTVETFRHWQRTRDDFQPCLIRKGRRLYVDMDVFERWLEKGREGEAPRSPEQAARRWPEVRSSVSSQRGSGAPQ